MFIYYTINRFTNLYVIKHIFERLIVNIRNKYSAMMLSKFIFHCGVCQISNEYKH